MTRAALYLRYSSDLQRATSLADQERECRQRCEREGFAVAQVYQDAALSGASLIGRGGMAALLADARAGRFDVVVVEHTDRLSRSQRDLADIYERLRFSGVRILSLGEGEVGTLHIGVGGMMNALFLENLKAKTRRGLEGVVLDGRIAGGLCYGYRAVPGKPGEREIVEEQAEVVRSVYDAYVAGDSVRTIADRLNRGGVPSARGGDWSPATITGNWPRRSGMLCNPLYIGRNVWNCQSFLRDPVTGKEVSRLNPESEWVWSDVPHLRIVSDEQWSAVRARKAGNAKRPRGKRAGHLLSGIATCGACGSNLNSRGRDRHGHIRLVCGARLQKGTCAWGGSIRHDRLAARVMDAVRRLADTPEMIEEFIRAYREEWAKLWAGRDGERKRLEARRREAASKLESLLRLVEAGTVSDAIAARIAERESEVRDADAALGNLPAERIAPEPFDLAGRLTRALDEAELLFSRDVARARAALAGVVSQARVGPHGAYGRPHVMVEVVGNAGRG